MRTLKKLAIAAALVAAVILVAKSVTGAFGGAVKSIDDARWARAGFSAPCEPGR